MYAGAVVKRLTGTVGFYDPATGEMITEVQLPKMYFRKERNGRRGMQYAASFSSMIRNYRDMFDVRLRRAGWQR